MSANPEIIYEGDSQESRLSLKNEDCRIYFREKVLLSDLQLEDGSRGIVLDISEQGLAMQSARTLSTESNPRLRFQLSQSSKWIEARGRIAWISHSRCAAGIEFNDLSYDALIAIKTWMFEIASLGTTDELEIHLSDAEDPQSPTYDGESSPKSDKAGRAECLVLGLSTEEDTSRAGVPEERAELESQPLSERLPLAANADSASRSEPQFLRKALLGSRRIAVGRWRVNIALAAWTAILVAFLILGLHRWMDHLRPPNRIAIGQRGERALTQVPSSAAPSRKPAASAPETFGYVLQVAAMQSESSALAIADIFRAKNLSVFVMKPAEGNLYLVLIGPYRDIPSAAIARADLKKQGLDVIQKQTSSLE